MLEGGAKSVIETDKIVDGIKKSVLTIVVTKHNKIGVTIVVI